MIFDKLVGKNVKIITSYNETYFGKVKDVADNFIEIEFLRKKGVIFIDCKKIDTVTELVIE